MKEIEAKAHVDASRVDEIKAYFVKKYSQPATVSKSDYYIKTQDEGKFRIRKDGEKYFWTKKDKSLDKNGIECNIETEYEIDKNKACDILKEVQPFFTKTKKGFLWCTEYASNSAHIELLNVEPLGWFLEIELLVKEDSSYCDIQGFKKWIMAFFDYLNLADCIEKRKYMEMLQDGR